MAGYTRGTYRNSIPVPPTLNLAYLKEYFEGGQEKKKQKTIKPPKRLWSCVIPFTKPEPIPLKVKANTKSEARSAFKKLLNEKRLPVGSIVKEVR